MVSLGVDHRRACFLPRNELARNVVETLDRKSCCDPSFLVFPLSKFQLFLLIVFVFPLFEKASI